MAKLSRWEEIKKTEGESSAETRTGIEQDFDLGQLIYDLRIEAGLSQRELAERMGTTQSAISRLEEGGGVKNRIDTLASVATALDRHLVCRSRSRCPTSSPMPFRWREKSSQTTHGTDVHSGERRGTLDSPTMR